jgi:CRP/FNR family transcriptional regulator
MSLEICKFCNKRSQAAKQLGNEELEKLGHSCVEVSFSKGDIIFKQNALSSNIIYIREGLVKIHITGPDREQILKIAKGPTYLGIPTTLGDKINHYSATAISPTEVCFIDINVFKDFISTNSDFAYEIIVNLCKNELGHFHRCVNQLQKQSPGRVAETLLFFANEIFENDTFDIPLTRHELGDLTGNSRENVSRILSDFNNENLIKINGKTVTITEKGILAKISKKG